jgi:hypothetical protein
MFHRRVMTRVTGASLGLLLAATVVGGAATVARAHTAQLPSTTDAAGKAALACSTESLGRHASGGVRFIANLGGTTAKLTGDAVTHDYQQWLKQPSLVLSDGHATWRVQPRPAPGSFDSRYNPIAIGVENSRAAGYVCLARFAAHQHPVAVVGVYSGGAHCCATYRVFDPATRQESQLDTGNSGATFVLGAKHALLQTADDAFSYVFTAFAYSGHPIQLMRPTATRFADVTAEHPARVRADARFWWQQFQGAADGRGILAAWAADEELLGRDHHVVAALDALVDDRRLAAHVGDRQFSWSGGKRYVAKLLRFLEHQGYRNSRR